MAKEKGKFEKDPQGGSVLPGILTVFGAMLALLLVVASLMDLSGQPFTLPAAPSVTPNPFAPADFKWSDGYLTCTGGTARMGIDVSAHQGEIDWEQVAESGVEFAFIRIGYRGYSQGEIYPDERAPANLRAAAEAGIPCGAYFYSQAVTPMEALEEAAFCVAFLQEYDIRLPVVFDWEYVDETARTGNVDRRTLTECTQTFCHAVESAGFTPMIYFNRSQGLDLLDLTQLTDYPWWLALYQDTLDFPHRVDVWQYTQNGNIPGITGDVDINLWFTYDESPEPETPPAHP